MKYLTFIFLIPLIASAQVPDGLPDPVSGKFSPVNVCYQASSGPVCEVFNAPEVAKDLSPTKFVELSPRDPSRTFEAIPSFGLAKFHWWIFSQGLFRAQREYTDCIGAIRELQRVMGLSLIDSASSPLLPAIENIRSYEVPFEAIQNIEDVGKPPSLRDAIEHVKAAVASLNITIAGRLSCQYMLTAVRIQFDVWLKNNFKKRKKMKGSKREKQGT